MPTAATEEVDFPVRPFSSLGLFSDGKRTHFLRCMQLKFILLKLPSIGAPCTDDGGCDESIENVVWHNAEKQQCSRIIRQTVEASTAAAAAPEAQVGLHLGRGGIYKVREWIWKKGHTRNFFYVGHRENFDINVPLNFLQFWYHMSQICPTYFKGVQAVLGSFMMKRQNLTPLFCDFIHINYYSTQFNSICKVIYRQF